MFDAARRRRVRRRLLAWYDRHARALPWRQTHDPYRILLSEFMLQQTRTETVLRYWPRMLERFPTLEALAAAAPDDVLAAWAGLGYYRRARNLHAAARAIVERFGGQVPRTAELLRTLPGVGRYTAGAIASIAFDERTPVLDGNVRRVLSRLAGWPTPNQARLWSLAEALLPRKRCGDFNQALMELGATLCSPVRPACDDCPLRADCRAAATGVQRQTGRGPRRARPRPVHAAAVAVRRRGRLLLVRRDADGLLAGFWGLPTVELSDEHDAAERLAALLERDFGLRAGGFDKLGEVEHVFTHRRLRLEVFRARNVRGRLRGDGRMWCWVEGVSGSDEATKRRSDAAGTPRLHSHVLTFPRSHAVVRGEDQGARGARRSGGQTPSSGPAQRTPTASPPAVQTAEDGCPPLTAPCAPAPHPCPSSLRRCVAASLSPRPRPEDLDSPLPLSALDRKVLALLAERM